MCRILAVQDRQPFAIADCLRALASIARNSREYQGDGWGCAWDTPAGWKVYRNIRPIWEDDLDRFGASRRVMVHARSAFRNEPPDVSHNMPFLAGGEVFIFNGELRGVSLRSEGRIGAEKLFHFVRRFAGGDDRRADLARALGIVRKKCRYIRAMNFVMAVPGALMVNAQFSEQLEYFTLHKKQAGTRCSICSEPFPGESDWESLPNNILEVFPF